MDFSNITLCVSGISSFNLIINEAFEILNICNNISSASCFAVFLSIPLRVSFSSAIFKASLKFIMKLNQ